MNKIADPLATVVDAGVAVWMTGDRLNNSNVSLLRFAGHLE
ncbi:hypothetical protein [Erwinia mallotivora]